MKRFKELVLDPWCFEVGQAEDPLVREEQKKAENSWRIHPSIDGCSEIEPPG
ncbi:MAG: hypothetical protein QGF20_08595 [Alphaproteobacteria bacterium]|nr:hypothetical protein [Alphaproteobacteria bacterium]